MTGRTAASNKAKIARRVVEVLDYFDDHHHEASVMDIVRRYGHPQSSTSELLMSLVELGLLAKGPHARSYRLTPRAALLGASGQPQALRDGRLVRLIDRLAAQTGLGAGLFALAGANAQLIAWRSAAHAGNGPYSGSQEPLQHSAAGWMLLSALDGRRSEGMLRRLNAEAEDHAKFSHPEMMARIEGCRCDGHAVGPSGFGKRALALAVLLPLDAQAQPLAVAVHHGGGALVNETSLLQSVREAIRSCFESPDTPEPAKLPAAA